MKLKVGACLGAVAMAASLLATMSPASADGENANATAIQSTLLDDPITAAQANCPGVSGPDVSTVPITIGNIVIGVAEAHCTNYSAKSAIASVKVYDPSDWRNTVSLSAIKSSCRNDHSRTSTVTVKTGNIGILAGPITAPVTIPLGAASIFLNEKFDLPDGGVGVNAVRVQLGGPEQGQNLILAQSICHGDSGFSSLSNNSSRSGGGLFGLGILGIL